MNTRSKIATAAFAAMLATAASVNVAAACTPLPDNLDGCAYLNGGLPYPPEPGTRALKAKDAQAAAWRVAQASAAGTGTSLGKSTIGDFVSVDQLNDRPLSEITVGCLKAILAQSADSGRFHALSGISSVPPACGGNYW